MNLRNIIIYTKYLFIIANRLLQYTEVQLYLTPFALGINSI